MTAGQNIGFSGSYNIAIKDERTRVALTMAVRKLGCSHDGVSKSTFDKKKQALAKNTGDSVLLTTKAPQFSNRDFNLIAGALEKTTKEGIISSNESSSILNSVKDVFNAGKKALAETKKALAAPITTTA
jgi:hypothetical protein